MTTNVGTNRKAYVTVEVANAIGNYVQFMDAGAGAYSNEMALKAGRNTSTSVGRDRTSVVM